MERRQTEDASHEAQKPLKSLTACIPLDGDLFTYVPLDYALLSRRKSIRNWCLCDYNCLDRLQRTKVIGIPNSNNILTTPGVYTVMPASEQGITVRGLEKSNLFETLEKLTMASNRKITTKCSLLSRIVSYDLCVIIESQWCAKQTFWFVHNVILIQNRQTRNCVFSALKLTNNEITSRNDSNSGHFKLHCHNKLNNEHQKTCVH